MSGSAAIQAKAGRDDVVSWVLTSKGKIASLTGINRCVLICTKDNASVVIDSNNVAGFDFAATKIVNGQLTHVVKWKLGLAINNLLTELGLWKADAYLFDAVHTNGLYAFSFDLQVASISGHVIVDVPITTNTGQLTTSGYAPSLVMSQVRKAAAAVLTLSGNQPTVINARVIVPNVGTLAFTGNSARVDRLLIQPNKQSLTLTGNAPVVANQIRLVPGSTTLALSGNTPVIGTANSVVVTITTGEDIFGENGYVSATQYLPDGLSYGSIDPSDANINGYAITKIVDEGNQLIVDLVSTAPDDAFSTVSYVDNNSILRTYNTSSQASGFPGIDTDHGTKSFGWDKADTSSSGFTTGDNYTITFNL